MPWSVAVMVMTIVAVTMIAKVLVERQRALGGQKSGASDGAEAAAAREEVRQLKERVQVLERLITDNHGSVSLDREIERLRDRS